MTESASGKDILLAVGVAVGGYLLWNFFQKGKEFLQTAASGISKPIAYVISSVILPPAQHVTGGAVLPDGGYVSWDAIVQAGSKVDSRREFTWKGIRYRVTQRRGDGNYDTVRV